MRHNLYSFGVFASVTGRDFLFLFASHTHAPRGSPRGYGLGRFNEVHQRPGTMFFFFRGVPVQLEGRPASFQGEHTSAADPDLARKSLQIPKKSRANKQKSGRNVKEIVKFNPPKPYIFGWLEAIISPELAPNQSVEALPKPPDAPGYLATHLGERPEPISRQAKRLETQFKGRAAQQPVPNPMAMALIRKAQTNPKIMKALQDVQTNGPSAMQKYAGDPEVMAVVRELQQERPLLEVSPPLLEGHVPQQLLPRPSTAARGPFSFLPHLGGAHLPKPQPMGQITSSASFHRGPRDTGLKRNEYMGAAPSYIGPDYPAREYHFETPSQRPAYRYSGHDEHLGKAIDHLIRRTELERKAEDAAYRASVAEAWRVEPVIRQPHLHSPCFASPRKQSQPRKERLNGERREPVDALEHSLTKQQLEHTLTKQQRCPPRRPEDVPMLSIPGLPLKLPRPLSVPLLPLLPLLPLEVPPISYPVSSVLESSPTTAPIRDAGWAPGWEPAARGPVVAAAAPAPEASPSKPSAATLPAPQSFPAAFRLRAKRQQQDLQKQGRLQKQGLPRQGLPRQGLPAAPLRQLVPAALSSPRGCTAPRSLAVGNDERWPGHPSAPTAQSLQACTAAQALAVCTELGHSSPQLASASLARLAALCAGDGFLCAGPSSAADDSAAADAKRPQTPPTSVLESFEGGFEGLLMLLLQLLSTHRQFEPTLAAGCMLLVQMMANDSRKEAAVEAGAIGMLVDVLRQTAPAPVDVLRQTAPTPVRSCPATGASVHDLPPDEHGASSVEHPVAAAIACLALVSLASSSSQRTQRCVEQDALTAVVDAMLLQPHAKLLQLNGCMALVHLVRAGGSTLPDEVRCQAAARAGAATALTAALANHASYWATLTWAILGVLLITNSSALRALETINAGGRAALEHAAATLKGADGVEGQGFDVTTDGAGRLHIPVHSAVSLKSILTLIDLARAWLDLSAEAYASAKSRNVLGDEMFRPAVPPGEEFLWGSA